MDREKIAAAALVSLASDAVRFCGAIAESARRVGIRSALLLPGEDSSAWCRDGESLLGAALLQNPGEDEGKAFMITLRPRPDGPATVCARFCMVGGTRITDDGRIAGTPTHLPGDAAAPEGGGIDAAAEWLAASARKAFGAAPPDGGVLH